ncbi:MAG: hypothetical protein IPI85_12980 [Dehalococcoidia bacterium]|nr:hypothetical protein [Dehalococcoidia bacterium]
MGRSPPWWEFAAGGIPLFCRENRIITRTGWQDALDEPEDDDRLELHLPDERERTDENAFSQLPDPTERNRQRFLEGDGEGCPSHRQIDRGWKGSAEGRDFFELAFHPFPGIKLDFIFECVLGEVSVEPKEALAGMRGRGHLCVGPEFVMQAGDERLEAASPARVSRVATLALDA